MRVHSILQLLVLIEEAKTQVELISELESVLRAYSFDYYGIWFHHKPVAGISTQMLVGSWPDGWRRIYMVKKYSLIDPVRRMLAIAQRPFRWRNAVNTFKNDPSFKRMMRMMQDAAKHQLTDGYTFPFHGKTGLLGHFSIGGHPVDLSPAETALFEAAGRRLFWRLLELNGMASELETTAIMETELTRRQMEVLALLAEGMTSNEIAKDLQISNHTVDWYINVIQEKFNAKNRQHVVAIAFRLGLVS